MEIHQIELQYEFPTKMHENAVLSLENYDNNGQLCGVATALCLETGERRRREPQVCSRSQQQIVTTSQYSVLVNIPHNNIVSTLQYRKEFITFSIYFQNANI